MAKSVASKSCSALTTQGAICGKPVEADNLCKTHRAARAAQEQRYRAVIKAAMEACSVRGWGAEIEHDDKDFHFVTIAVWKEIDGETITGQLNMSVNDKLIYSIEKTSFYSYGIKDLLSVIGLKINELPFLEKENTKAEKEKRQELERKQQEEQRTVRLILRVLANFDRVARQLRRRRVDRPAFELNDEYDVQDLLHAVLKAYFDDVRPEEQTPSHAGGASRMDFLLKIEQAVIEVKFATPQLRDKQIGEELFVDIKRYQSHPDCKGLYCLVYDPQNNVKNPVGLERDLSRKHDSLDVFVIVVPQ